jgi:hypothetical protein
MYPPSKLATSVFAKPRLASILDFCLRQKPNMLAHPFRVKLTSLGINPNLVKSAAIEDATRWAPDPILAAEISRGVGLVLRIRFA